MDSSGKKNGLANIYNCQTGIRFESIAYKSPAYWFVLSFSSFLVVRHIKKSTAFDWIQNCRLLYYKKQCQSATFRVMGYMKS